MNAFRNDLRALVSRHVAAAPMGRVLDLVDTLSRPDISEVGLSNFAPMPRFVRLAGDGEPWLDEKDGEHVAVHDHNTGLIWSAGIIGEADWEGAKKLASGCRLMGKDDWRLPTVQELLGLIDYERYEPAVDPGFFKGPYGYTWSSTVAKSPSGCAWDVDLSGGGSSRGYRSGRIHVRAVRAGQSLGLGI
jgi:hypothetical protein